MRYAYLRQNNKKGQKPHTNTLETKTIRTKSWRNTFLSLKRTPAIAAIAAGFFVVSATSAASLQQSQQSDTIDSAETPQTAESYQAPDEETEATPSSDDQESNQSSVANSADSSIRIETKIESKSSGSTEQSTTTERQVTVNDVPIDIPERGSYKQTIRDETGETTIRVRGNGTGMSLHADIKNSEEVE